MKYKKSLFIFRRDLRIYDNRALHECLKNSEQVLPFFVFNNHQIDPQKNEYFTEHGFNFMIESLDDLQRQFGEQKGKLFFTKDKLEDLITTLVESEHIEALYYARDYTPFSLQRDVHMREVCDKLGIDCIGVTDITLSDPEVIATGSGTRYKVFTPFAKKAREQRVPEPVANDGSSQWITHCSVGHKIDELGLVKTKETNEHFTGGRDAGLKQMDHIKNLRDYKEQRDIPAKLGTSKLSPHLKFGTISPREVYFMVGKLFGFEHHLIAELYWRDFYLYLALHFPHVFEKNFSDQYDHVVWDEDGEKFEAWCKGKTGYPIVDAGMRELVETGWMHNRVRMIVASFLTKHLHIHWREGEKFFAKHLVDYDPSVNNGSWQWAASTGADAQPYFRIFNPWLQQKRFDPDAEYIKKWVPELRDLDPKYIHDIEKHALLRQTDYPAPIVEHKRESTEAKARFKVM